MTDSVTSTHTNNDSETPAAAVVAFENDNLTRDDDDDDDHDGNSNDGSSDSASVVLSCSSVFPTGVEQQDIENGGSEHPQPQERNSHGHMRNDNEEEEEEEAKEEEAKEEISVEVTQDASAPLKEEEEEETVTEHEMRATSGEEQTAEEGDADGAATADAAANSDAIHASPTPATTPNCQEMDERERAKLLESVIAWNSRSQHSSTWESCHSIHADNNNANESEHPRQGSPNGQGNTNTSVICVDDDCEIMERAKLVDAVLNNMDSTNHESHDSNAAQQVLAHSEAEFIMTVEKSESRLSNHYLSAAVANHTPRTSPTSPAQQARLRASTPGAVAVSPGNRIIRRCRTTTSTEAENDNAPTETTTQLPPPPLFLEPTPTNESFDMIMNANVEHASTTSSSGLSNRNRRDGIGSSQLATGMGSEPSQQQQQQQQQQRPGVGNSANTTSTRLSTGTSTYDTDGNSNTAAPNTRRTRRLTRLLAQNHSTQNISGRTTGSNHSSGFLGSFRNLLFGVSSSPSTEFAVHHQQQQQPDELDTNHMVHAVAVTADDHDHEKAMRLEKEIRQKILQEAIEARTVVVATSDRQLDSNHDTLSQWKKRHLFCIGAAILLILLMGIGLGLGLGLSSSSSTDNTLASSTGGDSLVENNGTKDDTITIGTVASTSEPFSMVVEEQRSTLQIVRERGYIICGISEFGFASPTPANNPNGDLYEGFNAEQCKAMALLALGDSSKYQQVQVDFYTRWEYLLDKKVDIIVEASTHTMERDVYFEPFKVGFSFTMPYFYSGLAFGGIPEFVDCADQLEDFYGTCRDLKICVTSGSTAVDILENLLRGSVLVKFGNSEDLAKLVQQQICNVVAADYQVAVTLQRLFGDNWKLGSNIVSKEPLSVVTREDDPEWFALASLMVNTLILAEAHNISKTNSHEMASLFGNKTIEDDAANNTTLASMMVSLVSEFGNYGDLYDMHIAPTVPRTNALNKVYTQSHKSGLLYSFPFGEMESVGPAPFLNSTLDTIQKRGYLICGVQPSRGQEFARASSVLRGGKEWSGLDVQVCQGVAAAIFAGDKAKIQFVDIGSMSASFKALTNGTVDVVAGGRVSLQATYHEPITGQGYAFSTPYFYGSDEDDAFALLATKNDTQWNDFLNWIVMALVYAEEEAIKSENSVDMPVVGFFGEDLKQMFRDCISVVGSYAELYNTTLSVRSGGNRLNVNPYGPQMFPVKAV